MQLVVLVCIGSSLVACSGLPDHLTRKYENIPQQLKQHEEKVAALEKTYKAQQQSKEWAFAKSYADKEKWNTHFETAHKKLIEANSYFEATLKPRYERNKEEETQDFNRELEAFDKLLFESVKSARFPSEREAFLLKAKADAKIYFVTANTHLDHIYQLQLALFERGTQAITDYPHKDNDVSKRLDQMDAYVNAAKKDFSSLEKQYLNHKNNKVTDYSILGDAKIAIDKNAKDIKDYESTTSKKFDELYTSYTRILADQKIDYFVVIGRASWCEGEYCGNGRESTYPAKKVDAKIFEYFDSYKNDLVATMRGGWSASFTLQIPQSHWDTLKINKRDRMNKEFDYADYWVQKTYTKSYHKYIDIIDDKQTTTKWIEVKETDFWNQFDNLGMSILTKPFGYYKEDTLDKAEPVGMAMVAPLTTTNGSASGSNRYGEWRTNSQGSSFWHYYGMYSFMNSLAGGNRAYSGRNWRHYSTHNNSSPYYGENREYGTYGSTTYSNGRYSRSEHARRNPGNLRKPSSDSFNRGKTSSIRNAGGSTRGRGAAGGGK